MEALSNDVVTLSLFRNATECAVFMELYTL